MSPHKGVFSNKEFQAVYIHCLPIQSNTHVAAYRIKNMTHRQMKVTAHEGGTNVTTYKYKPYRRQRASLTKYLEDKDWDQHRNTNRIKMFEETDGS
jgi:hypothetical protein